MKMADILGDDEIEIIGDIVDWDFFNFIPEEIILKIFSYLSPYTDTKVAKLVNRRWNRLISEIEHHNKRAFLESMRNSSIMWEMHKQKSYDITDTLVPGTRLRGFRTKVQKPNNNVPCPRYSHASVLIDQYLYIFGGSGTGFPQGSTFNDIFRLDLSTRSWEKIKVDGLLPAPRECCSFVGYKQLPKQTEKKKSQSSSNSKRIQRKSKIVMFGGWCQPPMERRIRGGARFFEDTQIFHVDELKWERLPYNQQKDIFPTARAGHSCSVIGNLMVMFGGSQRNNRLNDVWVLNLDTLTWRHQYIRNKIPRERFGHSQFTLNEKSILLLGGCGGPSEIFADAWLLNIEKWTWHQLDIKDQIYEPPDIWCHPSVMIDQDLVVFSEEKKCAYCSKPTHSSPLSTHKPNVEMEGCSHGQVKSDEGESPRYNSHLQMYVLDCTTLFADSVCRWLPSKYLSPAPPTRRLFTANVGINEVLLFGGLALYNHKKEDASKSEASKSEDTTIVVKMRSISH